MLTQEMATESVSYMNEDSGKNEGMMETHEPPKEMKLHEIQPRLKNKALIHRI